MDALEARLIERDAVFAYRTVPPDRLRLTGLYVAGSLEALAAPTVAIVGSRAPSPAGRRLARSIAAELARAGVCVISGLALGIDGAAHLGALDAGAPTIGVLGGGHRHFFPASNLGLARAIIAAGGAVVSPYPPDQPALPHQFLQRNGVVAALAQALVVIEAAARSGALNTAGWAADLGIPVLAFPGDVDRPKVAGCHALIRDGAILARDAADILAELKIPAGPAVRPFPDSPHDPVERALLQVLEVDSAQLDLLVARVNAPPAAVIAALSKLEIAGHVARDGINRFVASTPCDDPSLR